MTDFELQRRLRDLRVPVEPARDLFPAIAARIAGQALAAPVRRQWRRWPLAAAAAILIALVTAVGIGRQDLLRIDSTLAERSVDPSSLPGMTAAAIAQAPGGDPRLAAATLVVDDAHAQLERAMADRPDAVFLVSLMNRTNAQRMKLERLGSNAG
ncbi:MAG: hypothetical protein ABIR16_05875 [Dokdonella sp.]